MPQFSVHLFEHALPAVPGSVGVLRHAVVDLLAEADVRDERIAEVELAISEACSNVVIHAYPDATPGPIRVRAAIDEEDVLVVTVADEGRGMAPRPDSPGYGLGLPLIGRLASAFEVETPESGPGTVLRMRFDL
jgi:serine/threonine-protein kinase RsbW